MMWDQLSLQGTPYGHFAQVCEAGANFRTSVKTGNHAPPEHDGVFAAGKRVFAKKSGKIRNDPGILEMEHSICTRGESIKFKSDVGAGHGVPNQDHFTYEKGEFVTDNEFPLGKKIFNWKH